MFEIEPGPGLFVICCGLLIIIYQLNKLIPRTPEDQEKLKNRKAVTKRMARLIIIGVSTFMLTLFFIIKISILIDNYQSFGSIFGP